MAVAETTTELGTFLDRLESVIAASTLSRPITLADLAQFISDARKEPAPAYKPKRFFRPLLVDLEAGNRAAFKRLRQLETLSQEERQEFRAEIENLRCRNLSQHRKPTPIDPRTARWGASPESQCEQRYAKSLEEEDQLTREGWRETPPRY